MVFRSIESVRILPIDMIRRMFNEDCTNTDSVNLVILNFVKLCRIRQNNYVFELLHEVTPYIMIRECVSKKKKRVFDKNPVHIYIIDNRERLTK